MDFNKCLMHFKRIVRGKTFQNAYLKQIENFNGNIDSDSSFVLLTDLCNSNAENARCLTLYVLLNSCNLEELRNSFKVGLFVDEEFQFSPQWAVHFIIYFKLYDYLEEAVTYGPAGITINLVGTYLEKMLKITDLEHILNVLKALWHKMNNLSIIPPDFINFFDAALLSLYSLCQNFEHPIRHYLLVNFVIDCFASSYKLDECLTDFYDCGGEFCSMLNALDSKNTLQKCLQDLVTCVGEVFAEVSFETWISWSDSHFSDSSASIQRDMGNSIFQLLEKISNSDFEMRDDLFQCLNFLKIVPLSLEQEIATSDLETILEKLQLNDDENRSMWYKALLARTNSFENKELLLQILSNLALADKPENVAASFLTSHWKIDHELKITFLDSLKKLDVSKQLNVLEQIFDSDHDQSLSLFQNGVAQRELTEVINKISASSDVDEVLRQLIHLIVQQCKEVFIELFRLTLVSSENHTLCSCILGKIKFLFYFKEKNCSNQEQTVFSYVLENVLHTSLTDKQSDLFITFLNCLICNNVLKLDNVDFIITKDIEDKIVLQDWNGCKTSLAVISLMFSSEAEEHHDCALLVFLACVLAKSSWSFETFEAIKVEVFSMVFKALENFRFHKQKETEITWAKRYISNLPEIIQTAFYFLWEPEDWLRGRDLSFQLLLLSRSRNIDNAGALLGSPSHHSLTMAVCRVLPVLLREEWTHLDSIIATLKSYETSFDLLSEAMSLLALCTEKENSPCFLSCMTNYTSLFMNVSTSNESSYLFRLCRSLLRPIHRLKNQELKNQCYLIVIQKLGVCSKKLDEEHFSQIVSRLPKQWRKDFNSLTCRDINNHVSER